VYSENNDKPRVALVDYGMGNLRSVQRALERVGAAVHLAQSPAQVGGAQALVFPGQGAIMETMRFLKATGFDVFLKDWIAADRPFFGVCLGLQALFEFSEEGGGTPGLSIFKGQVRRFELPQPYRIPHMGWNEVRFANPADPILDGIAPQGDPFYFVHSYRVVTDEKPLVWGVTDYGGEFVSAVRRGNCVATQFHPEKSQMKGLRLYQNFLHSLPNLS